MIDIEHLEKYKENNRIEAKKALGGFPQSLWETYSAFANTLGGIILLGVEENPDKSLFPINLPEPEKRIAEFWEHVNNPKKVSVNILSDDDVQIVETNGCHIVVITVPRAEWFDTPVYLNDDMMNGTYKRNGEGDYKCTKEEIEAMLQDSASETQRYKNLIAEYLTDTVSASLEDIAEHLKCKTSRIQKLLHQMTDEGMLVFKNRIYKLKS